MANRIYEVLYLTTDYGFPLAFALVFILCVILVKEFIKDWIALYRRVNK